MHCVEFVGIIEIDGSAWEIVFCWIGGLFVDVYGFGEYGVVDFGCCGFWVCDVVGKDDWVWGSS